MRLKTILPLTLLSLGIMGASVGAINSPLAQLPANQLQEEKQDLQEVYKLSMSKMFFYNNVAVANNNPYYYEVADEWLEKAYAALERIQQIEREQQATQKGS